MHEPESTPNNFINPSVGSGMNSNSKLQNNNFFSSDSPGLKKSNPPPLESKTMFPPPSDPV